MILLLKRLGLIFFLSIFLFSSCRTEDVELIESPNDESLPVNSAIANLMLRVSMNDGSGDNIIDQASCLDIQFPFTVIVNGEEIIVNDDDDLDTVEDIIDEFDNDTDTIEIVFPITIILSDYTEVIINNYEELNNYASQCLGDNEIDDDIECIDFHYPITVNIFNTSNELIETIILENDEDLYHLIDELDEDIIITIEFPITVTLWDGTEVVINNMQELQVVIEGAIDQCDEDDDNDYDDDDCDNCSTDDLNSILTDCQDWTVDKLERNDEDLEDQYVGYLFNFFSNGSLTVTEGGNTYNGSWQSNGNGNNITVDINIPDLPDFNDPWILHEIEQEPNETNVDLRLGDDRLRFESDCSEGGGGGGGTDLDTILTDGSWYVASYLDDGDDETADYIGYNLTFNINGTVTADNGTQINGTWMVLNGGNNLLLDFGVSMPFDEFNDDWDVLSATNTQVDLQDVSGGGGGTDTLIFVKN